MNTSHDKSRRGVKSTPEARRVRQAQAEVTRTYLELNPVTPATIRERRRKAAGKGARMAVLLIFFMAIVTAGHVITKKAFVDNQKFTLNELTVHTEGLVSKKKLLSVLDLQPGQSLMDVSLVDLRHKLEALPMVKRANVVREFPGHLVVHVEQRHPMAWVERLGTTEKQTGLVLIDKEGCILPPLEAGESLNQLPVFQIYAEAEFAYGEPFQSEALQTCLAWYKSYEASDFALQHEVHSVLAHKPYMLSVRFRDDFVVNFPTESHSYHLNRLSQLMAQVKAQKLSIETVDLLVQEFVPVTLKPSVAPQGTKPAQNLSMLSVTPATFNH